jgi:hypothetical protein
MRAHDLYGRIGDGTNRNTDSQLSRLGNSKADNLIS